MDRYMPRQKDVVWIDFDPSRGHEIRKRRPALVVSSNEYNRATHFVIVSPITSVIRTNPTYYTLHDYQTEGQVVTHQLHAYDFTSDAHRNIEYIEYLRDEDFYKIAQLISYDFGFRL